MKMIFQILKNLLNRKKLSHKKLNEKFNHLPDNIAKTVGFIEELEQEKVETEKKLRS